MANPTYPAVNFNDAVELNIFNANQFHLVMQGDINTDVITYEGNGVIPSVQKALHNMAVYKTPTLWVIGEEQTDLVQPRLYEDFIFVPISVPQILGTFPTDAGWKLYFQSIDSVINDSGYNYNVFTATAGQTQFDLSFDYDDVIGNLSMYVDGLKRVKDALEFVGASRVDLDITYPGYIPLTAGQTVEIIAETVATFTILDGIRTEVVEAREEALAAAAAAALSETNASDSEIAAGISETNAATSETNAATSETNAATSETNAGLSEGVATTQAGISTAQAVISTTKANEASSSASDALANELATDANAIACQDNEDQTLVYRNEAEVFRDEAAVIAGGDYPASQIVEDSSHRFTNDVDIARLSGVEANATADQSGSEIKSLYEAQLNTNAYTDAELAKVSNATSKLAGIESGATADSQNDSYNATTASSANTLVLRDTSGYISTNYINSTADVTTATPSHIWMSQSSDNYLRKQTPARFIANLGLATSSDVPTPSIYNYYSASSIGLTNSSQQVASLSCGSVTAGDYFEVYTWAKLAKFVGSYDSYPTNEGTCTTRWNGNPTALTSAPVSTIYVGNILIDRNHVNVWSGYVATGGTLVVTLRAESNDGPSTLNERSVRVIVHRF